MAIKNFTTDPDNNFYKNFIYQQKYLLFFRMGNFLNKCWDVICFVGNGVASAISWFEQFREKVNSIVYSFVESKKPQIETASNPEKVGEVVIIKEYQNNLEKKAQELGKQLNSKDNDLVAQIMSKRN